MLDVQVRVPANFLAQARAVIRPGSPAFRRMYRAMATIYLDAMRTRFDRFSQGGGNWAPLARSTIEARARRPIARQFAALAAGDITQAQFDKRVKAARTKARTAIRKSRADRARGVLGTANANILRDTGTLFRGLSAMAIIDTPRGVSFGFAGPAARGNMTLARLAAIHQRGVPGKLPARPIFVKPDAQTLGLMRSVASDIIVREVHAAGRPRGGRR